MLKEDAASMCTTVGDGGGSGSGGGSGRELKPKALARLTRHAKGSLRKLNRIGRMSSTKEKSSKESSTERESSPAQSDSLESDPGHELSAGPAGAGAGAGPCTPAKRILARHAEER